MPTGSPITYIGVESENHFLLLRRPVPGNGGEDEAADRESNQGEQGSSGADEAGEGNTSSRENGERDIIKETGITFCLCYVPPLSAIRPTMANLVLMAGRRWGVEETMSYGKGPVGWDENQFRKWESLQHHTALAGIAMLRANMISRRVEEIHAGERADPLPAEGNFRETGTGTDVPEPEVCEDDLRIPLGDAQVPQYPGQQIPDGIGFIRLSLNEIMRLAAIACSGISDAGKAFHLRWSKWRRRHQAIARWHHRMARIKADQKVCSSPSTEQAGTIRNLHRGSLMAA
jgi:hypothetical protein